MTLHTYPHIEQGSEAWHDLRRGMLTASTIGQLITVRSLTAIEFACPACEALANSACRSKRADAEIKTLHPERIAVAKESTAPPIIEVASNSDTRALIAQLAAERITGWSDDNYVSWDMQRGHDDEPRAREFYAEHRAPVTECGFMVLEHGPFRIGFSPDGLVGDDGLIEVKSRSAKKQVAVVLAGGVPAEHMAQIQSGLFVSGRDWADYISWTGGMEFWTVRVHSDPLWLAAIVEAIETAEKAIAQMVNDYRAAVDGLPLTERAVLEVVI